MVRPAERNWFGSMFMLVLVPVAVIRFILFVPFGYYWTHGTNHNDVIKDHVLLYNGTYDPAIARGERIAANWGTFTFYWNFAVWIPSFWAPPPLNLPFTIIDIVATIYLSIATNYQTGYVPHDKGTCRTAATSWHRPPGANESFFEAAARLNGTVSTPVEMCKTFVVEWQYGITLSFFYALISLLNIIAFFGALANGRQEGESMKDFLIGLSKLSFSCFISIPKLVALGLVMILWWIPEGLFRCLPISWKANVRFGRRYALKTGLGLEQEAEIGVTELKDVYKRRKRRRHPPYQGGSGEPSPLSNFLGIYDMLMAVTEELHYSDVMSLSLVSKSVREAVLPSHDLKRRLGAFKTYTCRDNEVKDCWVCSKQICKGCEHKPLIREVTLFHHLHNCVPHCIACYKTVVKRRPGRVYQRTKAPHCDCAPRTAHPNFIQRWFNGSSYYSLKQPDLPKFARAVCQECNAHDALVLMEKRERRVKMELKKGMKKDPEKWTSCAKCNGKLGTGPRWWVCGRQGCGKECRSIVHKGWGRRDKRNLVSGGENIV